MNSNKSVSIVVPTLNEEGNIEPLVKRVDQSFKDTGVDYEIIFIDDHSADKTVSKIDELRKDYPIIAIKKQGERGKAYSLLEGFEYAQSDVICMIDADLQYPPEAIIDMYKLIESKDADMVITERNDHQTSKLRQLSSKTFNYMFTKLLFGFDYDSQSGLKVFKKKVIERVKLNPTPWSFDLEFIVRALEKNFKILNFAIPFSQRNAGVAKVKLLEVTYELAKASVKLRFNSSNKEVKNSYHRSLRFSQRVTGKMSAIVGALTFMAAFLLISNTQQASAAEIRLPLLNRGRDSSQQDDNKSKSNTSKQQQTTQTTPPTQAAPTTPTPAPAPKPVQKPASSTATTPKAETSPQPSVEEIKARQATYPNYTQPSDQYNAE